MLTHKGTQTLRTRRLTLRRLVPDDAEMVFAWTGDPEVCKYECWKPHPNYALARAYWSQGCTTEALEAALDLFNCGFQDSLLYGLTKEQYWLNL